ncbi:hypothetical protein H4219_002275 [Mycoemilia scoparia]|uniref:SH3 domain-containing protein n=1 Tax=Mycoemilia scoparia TaxID=417184 RepID=A0A9W8DU84_9FUNG|nr:hypothetical protein H4219_002275 [Mycoemilia scoparia]
MGINSPIPSNLASECRKAAKILNAFVDPRVAKGPDKVIPRNILQNCKGIAVMTVLKGGFIWSGRAGSGLVVARLADGTWSAPSAIGTAGVGFGGQIGGELTDFVIVLNTPSAVKAFSHGGNVTLGGNLSATAGPWGRNAEASGAILNVAPIFSYSKSKGLFAGVSLEGSVIVERKDANEKFYGKRVAAKDLLTGSTPPPPQADVLYRALSMKVTPSPSVYSTPSAQSNTGNDPYANNDPYNTYSAGPSALGAGDRSRSYLNGSNTLGAASQASRGAGGGGDWRSQIRATATVQPPNPTYDDDEFSGPTAHQTSTAPSYLNQNLDSKQPYSNATYGDSKFGSSSYDPPSYNAAVGTSTSTRGPPPPPPARNTKNQVRALYDFNADQPGDLAFRKGDIIEIVSKTESQNDWWEGRLRGQQGQFPANYVEFA